MPSEDTAALPLPPHRCMACGSDAAPFGFDTRAGTVWTCLAHREAGDAVLVAPTQGSLGRQPGGGDQR